MREAEEAKDGDDRADDITHKIVEDNLCGVAALLMMPMDHTVPLATNRVGPLAARISADPVIDATA